MNFIDWKTADNLVKSNEGVTKDSLIDKIINMYLDEVVTENDKLLLNLALSENPSQEKLNSFLSKWDIEVAGSNKALLLSYFMKRHPNLKFTDYEGPRLKGLLKFCRFRNLKTISHFTKLGRELNKNNVPILIMKGGAMKYLRPDLPRTMGDIDVLAPKNFKKVPKIMTNLGYTYENWVHSLDMHEVGSEEGTVDVHKYVDMLSEKSYRINKDLFARSKKVKAFGVDVYLPSNEDLFFLTLVNLAKNLRAKTSSAGILFSLFDCKYLIETKPDFNWDIVYENAKKTGTKIPLSFAIRFINKIVPEMLPLKNGDEVFERETNNYCKIIWFERVWFPDFQEKIRKIKFGEQLKKFNLLSYFGIKLEYKFIKWFNNNDWCKNLYINYAK